MVFSQPPGGKGLARHLVIAIRERPRGLLSPMSRGFLTPGGNMEGEGFQGK